MLKEIKVHLQDAAKREERLTRLEGSQEKLATLSKEREQLRQENEQVGCQLYTHTGMHARTHTHTHTDTHLL